MRGRGVDGLIDHYDWFVNGVLVAVAVSVVINALRGSRPDCVI